MALGDDVTGSAPDIQTGPPGGGGPGGPPSPMGGPPQMAGAPALAALARRGQQPQVSSPGMGNMAQGLMQLKTAVDMLQAALPNLGTGSKQHTDCLKALQSLSKHLPQGAPTAGVQQTQLQDLLRNTIRNAMMQRLIGQQSGGGQAGGGPGGPGAPGGGGMQPSPAPSMPLPGA